MQFKLENKSNVIKYMSSLAVAVFPDFENTAKSKHSEQTESSYGLTNESLFKLTGMHPFLNSL